MPPLVCQTGQLLDNFNPYQYRKGDIEALEKVQKKATKILQQLKNFKYEDRLRACRLPTLYFRGIRGDRIETFKIVTGIYDKVVSPTMLVADLSYAARGHDFRLQKIRARYDLRNYYFTNRVVNVWNSLSNYAVSEESVNCFKNRLDNFLKDQGPYSQKFLSQT